MAWSGYARWLRRDGEHRIWVRRGRCRACRHTHALLPDFVHARRLDAVEVIGAALECGIDGTGMRAVALRLGLVREGAGEDIGQGFGNPQRSRDPTGKPGVRSPVRPGGHAWGGP